jgi:plastocyanin
MRRILVVAVVAVVVVSGGLLPARAGAEQRVVTAFGFRYNPSSVEIASGDTLAFLNTDPLAGEGHSVTHAAPPGEQLFDSPITPGGGLSEVSGVAELGPGSYRFTCRVHAFMTGVLTVGGS